MFFQCLQFLYGNNGNIDEAAKRIEKYYEIKTSTPELFWNRDPESEELKLSFKIQQMAPLSITPNNCFVFMQRTVDLDTQKFNFDSVFKIFMMMAGMVGFLQSFWHYLFFLMTC